MTKLFFAALTGFSLATANALACEKHLHGHGDDMQGNGHNVPKGADTPASRALDHANATMHADMDITYTGKADVDFLRGMIAHHQGAVDMAQIVLKYGNNAQVRRLAMDIIRNQNVEISWMRNWLAQMEGQPKPAPLKLSGWNDGAWPGDTWLGER